MEQLLNSIEDLKQGQIGKIVKIRMAEFAEKGKSTHEEIFKELCFCLLTANYTSEGGIRIQKAIDQGFITLPRQKLAAKLKRLGYRFPNARAKYITEARRHLPDLLQILNSTDNDELLREWFAENVLGLGYKESSHFLRNIGHTNLAIIDFHIIDILVQHQLIEKPKSKSLSKKHYLKVENVLSRVTSRCGVSQGELDLYLWYLETGKVLK